jgi:DNA-binding transcriptional LysR family regulator
MTMAAAQSQTPQMPHISLEQWRALLAVVEAGGYSQAAEALHKSQSAVTYAVQKIESLLKIKAFEIKGRKAVLTPSGEVLYRRARTLVEESLMLERSATAMSADWKPEISMAIDTVFPTWLLLDCLAKFAEVRPSTRLEIYETVLGGTTEAVVAGQVDLAIASEVPAGYSGESLLQLRFIPVARRDHPLHKLGRELTFRDLRHYRQIVIRDSGVQRTRSGGWLGADQRWTVSHKATSLRAVTRGYGFAWFPEDNIREELTSGELVPLRLKSGAERFAQLYLIYSQRDYVDRDTQLLGDTMVRAVKAGCAAVNK